MPVAPTPAPTLDPAPAPAVVVKPTAFFESRPIATAPAAAAPAPSAPASPMPAPAVPVASVPAPTFETRPLQAPTPVAVCAAPPAQPEEGAPATSKHKAASADQPAAVLLQAASRLVASVQADNPSAPADKKKDKAESEPMETGSEPATSDAPVAPVPMQVMERAAPTQRVPLNIPAGATPQRMPREGDGANSQLDPKSRQAAQAPRPGGFQPHALDALLPADRAVSPPAARAAAEPAPEPDAQAVQHKAMPYSVRIEELHVESGVAHEPAPKSPASIAAEPKKKDVEPGIVAAGGTGGDVSSHGQRLGYDAPVATDGAVEMRHAEEPSRPPAPTDRVTLHLPDDAGGGRIQIAVRGDVVHARIVSADEAGTRELQAGADELRGALTRQGFQETHVRIDGGRVAADGWQRGAGAGMGAAAAGESAGSGDGRMHDSQQQDRRERHHGAPEDPRSDPRRQHPDGRSQQRARRERER
jgi:hypothetical protein